MMREQQRMKHMQVVTVDVHRKEIWPGGSVEAGEQRCDVFACDECFLQIDRSITVAAIHE